jgi:biopolymer transport protein ExbB/TolQ
MESIASFFRDGGIFMYFILGTAVVGIAIMIERGIVLLLRYNIDARALWNRVSKFIEDGDVEKAKLLCDNSRAPLLRILYTGISLSHGTEKEIQNAIDETALEIVPGIDKRVSYLSTLANIATLLGLLGTIQGLIQAFAAVGAADPSQKAALLASGISVALYTTAFGLIVAIPMLAGYTVLQSKAHKLIDEIDEFSVKLINLLNRRKSGLQTQ